MKSFEHSVPHVAAVIWLVALCVAGPAPRAVAQIPLTPSPTPSADAPAGLRVLPKPGVQAGLFYQNLKMPDGQRLKSAVTGYADNTLSLKGVDVRDKPFEIAAQSTWQLPARVGLESGFLFSERLPMDRILICREPTSLRTWGAPDTDSLARFERLAKHASTGEIFADVPEGYVVFHMMMYSGNHLCGVELTSEKGGKNFAVVDGRSFVSLASSNWWNRNSGARNLMRPENVDFHPVDPDPQMVLFSVSDPSRAILRNSSNAMKRVWIDQNPENQNLSLVETDAGWMAGLMRLIPAAPEGATTWSEAMDSKSGRYAVRVTKSREIKPGSSIMQFREFGEDLGFGGLESLLDSVRLSAADLKQIRERGLHEVFPILTAPDQVAFRPIAIAKDSAANEERVRQKLEVNLGDVTPDALEFRIRDRIVFRDVTILTSGATQSVSLGNPKARTDEATIHLPMDPDGGLRLTNGESIFEIRWQDDALLLNEIEVADGTVR